MEADLVALYNSFPDRSIHVIYLMGTGTHKVLFGFKGTREYGQFLYHDYSGSGWQVGFRVYGGEAMVNIN